MSDDIVTRLRVPTWPCICVDTVLINCVPCNARLDAAAEIERLREQVQYRDDVISMLRREVADLKGDVAELKKGDWR